MTRHEAVAVLVSGGVDSAVLTMELAETRAEVHPVYVRHGLIWEDAELEHLRAFLRAAARPAVRELTILDLPVTDLYGEHWATTGRGVPGSDTPDEAVYLPGRNLMLLAKVAVFCERRGIRDVALAPLHCNPFADNTDEFYEAMRGASERALGCALRFLRPYTELEKSQVVLRGRGLPLHLTFSCMRPVRGLHCGTCNKCAERIRGFAEAGVADLTVYATQEEGRKVRSV